MVGAAIPLIFDPRFYFTNDTEAGAFGQWYEIGERVLRGDWSLLNPAAWQAGNYLVDGAWGIFSPPLWLVGLAAHLFADAAVMSTVVKFVFLLVASAGVFLLTRSYGASPAWSSVAALAAPLAGFTLYFDAASWVNGLMAWAFWPLAFGMARRAALGLQSAAVALIPSLLLVGIGYVQATLFLAATLALLLIEAIVGCDRDRRVRTLLVSVGAGLFAIIVHLPGVLISPVTGRTVSGISNDGFLTVDFSDLFASSTAAGSPLIPYYEGVIPGAPITYIAWFLPAAAFVSWSRFAPFLRQHLSLPLLAAFALLAVLAPSQVGPLRYPIRMTPYLTVLVLVIVCAGLSAAAIRARNVRRLMVAFGGSALSAWLMIAQNPASWRVVAVVTVVSLIALWALYRLLTAGPPQWVARRLPRRNPTALAAVAIALVSLALLLPQHRFSPQSPLRGYGMPSEVADYKTPLEGARGDALVVGQPTAPGIYDESLVGNTWYVNPVPVQNVYTSVHYPGYERRLCMEFNGTTCAELFERLFEPQPQTGEDLADLLGVSSILLLRDSVEVTASEVPDGWQLVDEGPETQLLVRDEPIGGAGTIAYSSEEMSVELVHSDAMGTTFRVDSVPKEGGEVALRLIPWPGYEVRGGELDADPIEDFLLTVKVDTAAEGQTVSVAYRAPGWPAEVAAAVLLVGVAIALVVSDLRRGRGRALSPTRG